jgi:hypothetical protein
MDWTLVKDATLPIDATKPVLVGLDSSTASKTLAATATVDNVSVSSDIVQPNPPAGPGLVQATPGTGAVLISYTNVANAVGYNIYRRVAGSKDPAVKANAQPDPYAWFIDDNGGKGLPNGTHYIYSVAAVTNSLADPTKTAGEGAHSAEVLVTPQMPVALPNANLWAFDIGTLNPSTVALDTAKNTLSVTASGADIWDVSDSGTFLVEPVSGDYSVSAELLAKPVSNNKAQGYVKNGITIREGMGVSDRYAGMWASSGNGLLFEFRRNIQGAFPDDKGGMAAGRAGISGGPDDKHMTFPLWMRLTRQGALVRGFFSEDGSSFTEIGKGVNFDRLEPVTWGGLALTAHDDGKYTTGQYAANSIVIGPANVSLGTPPAATPATPPAATGTTTTPKP